MEAAATEPAARAFAMKASPTATVDERTLYGGQAVVEGVMMRSPRFYAVACRRLSNGEIVIRQENVESMMAKWQWLNKPFLRGTLALVDAMAMGIKALTYAANVQAADEIGQTAEKENPAGEQVAEQQADKAVETVANQSINGIAIGATMVLAILIGFLMFWELPLVLVRLLEWALHIKQPTLGQSIAFNLGEGVIRIAIFLGYVLSIARLAHVKRVFQYHGAEHKAINALEAGRPLTLESARESSRIHPRCGTNFIFLVLMVVLILNPVIFVFWQHPPLWSHGLVNLVMLPIVAGIAFEILKFAGNHRDKKWAQWLVAPGLATQYLTTRVPDDSQIEVALAALISVWDKEHEVATVAQAPVEPEPAAAVA